jgi:hypothetical protein
MSTASDLTALFRFNRKAVYRIASVLGASELCLNTL